MDHSLPILGLRDYILLPGIQVNFFLYSVTLYKTDAILFIYLGKVAWAAKEIATVG